MFAGSDAGSDYRHFSESSLRLRDAVGTNSRLPSGPFAAVLVGNGVIEVVRVLEYILPRACLLVDRHVTRVRTARWIPRISFSSPKTAVGTFVPWDMGTQGNSGGLSSAHRV